MNYATDYTVILTALYILIIAIAFAPKCPQTVSPVGAVEYFPEIDDEPMVPPSPAPIPIVENLPVEPTVIATVTTSPVNLENLTSKELKRMARTQKIPRYGSLTKKALILLLT